MAVFKVKKKLGKPKQDEIFRNFKSTRLCPDGFKFYKIERGKLIFRRIKPRKRVMIIKIKEDKKKQIS